jgi:hypothetical protein
LERDRVQTQHKMNPPLYKTDCLAVSVLPTLVHSIKRVSLFLGEF